MMKFVILLFISVANLLLVNGFSESFFNFESNVENSNLYTVTGKIDVDKLSAISKDYENLYWCYDKYPCFQIGGPFISVNHPISLPPYPPKFMGVKMELYTRKNSDKPYVFYDPDDVSEISQSNFNSSVATTFLIGGFTSGDGIGLTERMLRPLLANSDCNIFNVNWLFGSLAPYPIASANGRLVGAITGRFIELLHNNTGLSYSQCHLIGGSLGAHICGYVGYYLKGQIGRITGLDPSGIAFNGTDPVVRLDPTDAQFVDVIHTDAGHYFDLKMGIDQAIGHVDIWPNGGRQQPHCPPIRISTFAGVYNEVVCPHRRAADLFAESIPTLTSSNCRFTAYPCLSYSDYKCNRCFKEKTVEMGFNAYKYAENNAIPASYNFYLDTNEAPPYCKSNAMLKSC